MDMTWVIQECVIEFFMQIANIYKAPTMHQALSYALGALTMSKSSLCPQVVIDV